MQFSIWRMGSEKNLSLFLNKKFEYFNKLEWVSF